MSSVFYPTLVSSIPRSDMKVLVIEDEPKVVEFIKKGLEEKGFEVVVAYDGQMGERLARDKGLDIIILDVILPYQNGLAICRKIREYDQSTPVLMLTALGTLDDKISGFDAGADDYLVKPFEFKELLARINALTKRSGMPAEGIQVLKIADLELNLDRKSAKREGKNIELTAKEFGLLEYLLRNKGRVVSRADIAEKVWDIHFDTGTNVVDVYINILRKKIDRDFDKKLIHTRIGLGYTIDEE
jgi:two-component system copper resistance phosphate regulon response regulator CusR